MQAREPSAKLRKAESIPKAVPSRAPPPGVKTLGSNSQQHHHTKLLLGMYMQQLQHLNALGVKVDSSALVPSINPEQPDSQQGRIPQAALEALLRKAAQDRLQAAYPSTSQTGDNKGTEFPGAVDRQSSGTSGASTATTLHDSPPGPQPDHAGAPGVNVYSNTSPSSSSDSVACQSFSPETPAQTHDNCRQADSCHGSPSAVPTGLPRISGRSPPLPIVLPGVTPEAPHNILALLPAP